MFRTVDQLNAALSGSSLRHAVLSNNLANANTPGFKRSDVKIRRNFSQELQSARNTNVSHSLVRTHPNHLPSIRDRGSQFSIAKYGTTSMRNDGNNVDPDREMALVLENQLHYQSLADAVGRKLSQLRRVIGEGRR